MNQLDNLQLDEKSFSYLDLIAQDRWETWTPVFGDWLYSEGNPPILTGSARFRVIGRQVFVQIQVTPGFITGTVESIAGTSYINPPLAIAGYGGSGTMTNISAMVASGVCVFSVLAQRIYVPTQAPTNNTLLIAGWYEI